MIGKNTKKWKTEKTKQNFALRLTTSIEESNKERIRLGILSTVCPCLVSARGGTELLSFRVSVFLLSSSTSAIILTPPCPFSFHLSHLLIFSTLYLPIYSLSLLLSIILFSILSLTICISILLPSMHRSVRSISLLSTLLCYFFSFCQSSFYLWFSFSSPPPFFFFSCPLACCIS